MNQLKMDPDVAADLLDVAFSRTSEDITLIEEKILHIKEYSAVYEVVLYIDGKFYKTTYENSINEHVDIELWEDLDEVIFTEVQQIERVCKVWEEV